MKHTQCCCTCKHQKKLFKHPANTSFGKGSIKSSCGWICTNNEFSDGAIFFDKKHGVCELYDKK